MYTCIHVYIHTNIYIYIQVKSIMQTEAHQHVSRIKDLEMELKLTFQTMKSSQVPRPLSLFSCVFMHGRRRFEFT